jgi:hypothetical protein
MSLDILVKSAAAAGGEQVFQVLAEQQHSN